MQVWALNAVHLGTPSTHVIPPLPAPNSETFISGKENDVDNSNDSETYLCPHAIRSDILTSVAGSPLIVTLSYIQVWGV